MSTSENVDPVKDSIYCEVHGDIHIQQSDPYLDGTQCNAFDWHALYMARRPILHMTGE